MFSKKDMALIAFLRQDCRQSLKNLSMKTSIPISTLHDKMKLHREMTSTKFVALLDFSSLGFLTKANISLRVDKEHRDSIRTHLMKHQNVNSLYRINNGFDFLAECIFRNIKELEDFTEHLESTFKIKGKEVHYLIEDLVREHFLSEPEMGDFQ